MNPLRRACAFAAPAALLALSPLARAAGDHGTGDPFSTLDPPLPTEAAGKIEVLEFFWYGCPHCAQLEPELERWLKTLPGDVAFRREHVVWDGRKETLAHARLFATLRSLSLVDAHQQAVFDAVHKDKVDFRDETAVFAWVARRGIDWPKFETMFKSFGMQAQLARARSLTSTYRVDGVPLFIVDGRFSTEPHRAGGERQVLDVINGLVDQRRATAKAK